MEPQAFIIRYLHSLELRNLATKGEQSFAGRTISTFEGQLEGVHPKLTEMHLTLKYVEVIVTFLFILYFIKALSRQISRVLYLNDLW